MRIYTTWYLSINWNMYRQSKLKCLLCLHTHQSTIQIDHDINIVNGIYKGARQHITWKCRSEQKPCTVGCSKLLRPIWTDAQSNKQGVAPNLHVMLHATTVGDFARREQQTAPRTRCIRPSACIVSPDTLNFIQKAWGWIMTASE